MGIELHIEPGRVVSREQFVSDYPRYSIALDGYVAGEPFFEPPPDGPRRNFNHHESVDRSVTCATCEQVRRAVLLGLFDTFRDDGGPRVELWANDCDQDICLATYIFEHPELASDRLIAILSQIEDLLDISGGWLTIPGHEDLHGEARWIFEPYTSRRPHLSLLDAEEMREVLGEVHGRIDRFLRGDAESLPLLGGYREIGGGEDWKLVELSHQHVRQKLVEDGVNAAVELYGRNGDCYVYTIWRRSEYVSEFPVREILQELNRVEGYAPDDLAGWGGSDNVGGSPRRTGSRLEPEQVGAVVERVLRGR